MTSRKVLFVCANRRASRPVTQALGRAGFRLQVVSGLSQISSVCRRAFDAIVVTEPRSASIWIDRLKRRNPGIAGLMSINRWSLTDSNGQATRAGLFQFSFTVRLWRVGGNHNENSSAYEP
jgi:hypothetical protein